MFIHFVPKVILYKAEPLFDKVFPSKRFVKHAYKCFPPETERPLLVIQHGGEWSLMLYVVMVREVELEIHDHLVCAVTVTAARRTEMENSPSMIILEIY